MFDISSKYVVLDLETNGLNTKTDDLLSISIYKPDNEIRYERFLPLELDCKVKTTDINGITLSDLIDKEPLTQKEFDDLIKQFELENRTILTYGDFDSKVLKNYLNRHDIKGFEILKFYNMNEQIFYERRGGKNATKDNLCNMFNIPSVTKIHSGINDCILEWQLFEKIHNKKLLIKNNFVYELSDDYILPVSYLYNYPKLKRSLPKLPQIFAYPEEIKRITVSGTNIIELPSDIIGKLVEIALKESLYGVIDLKKDSSLFLKENKQKLKCLGSLVPRTSSIHLNEDMDMYLDNLVDSYKFYEKSKLHLFVEEFKKKLQSTADFIKENTFNPSKAIYYQEFTLNKEDNILGLCDFSNEDAILEFKSYVLARPSDITYQLYYCAKGRECYLLELDWTDMPNTLDLVFSKVSFKNIGEAKEIRRKIDNTKHFDSDKKISNAIFTELLANRQVTNTNITTTHKKTNKTKKTNTYKKKSWKQSLRSSRKIILLVLEIISILIIIIRILILL